MGPYVGAVVADKNRDVANDANATLGAIGTQRCPLLEKGELQEALDSDRVLEIDAKLRAGPPVCDERSPSARNSRGCRQSARAARRTARSRQATSGSSCRKLRNARAKLPVRTARNSERLPAAREVCGRERLQNRRHSLRCEIPASRAASRYPRSTRRSRLTMSTFPANAEVQE